MTAIPGSRSLSHCGDFPAGQLVLGVAATGSLRWAAVDVGRTLETVRRQLDLSPQATIALGRTLTAAALLHRFTLKEPGRIMVEVAGDGPLGRVVAEIGEDGHLRGSVGNPRCQVEGDHAYSLGRAVGKGHLKVFRTTARKRYDSQVALVSGEIGEDLVHYLHQSEQIRSAAFVGDLLGPEGVRAAGGMLVEALPGTSEETLSHLEGNIARLFGVQAELAKGGVSGLVDAVLADFDREELQDRRVPYGCAEGRERIASHLAALSSQDLDDLVDATDRFTAECSYCGFAFTFSRGEIAPSN